MEHIWTDHDLGLFTSDKVSRATQNKFSDLTHSLVLLFTTPEILVRLPPLINFEFLPHWFIATMFK